MTKDLREEIQATFGTIRCRKCHGQGELESTGPYGSLSIGTCGRCEGVGLLNGRMMSFIQAREQAAKQGGREEVIKQAQAYIQREIDEAPSIGEARDMEDLLETVRAIFIAMGKTHVQNVTPKKDE